MFLQARSLFSRLDFPRLSSKFARFYKTEFNSIKVGQAIEYDGKPYILIGRHHGGTGRGQAVIKVDLKDPVSGKKTNIRLKGNDTIEVLQLTQRKFQFLYKEKDSAVLMNMSTFEEISLSDSLLEEGMEITVQYLEPDIGVLSWRLPQRCVYKVESVSQKALKAKGTTFYPARIESGIEIQVPDYVKPGEKVTIDTDTLEYISRQ
ncbi:hypothetical protein BB560_007172 [Smittium megazygosporum]|uniref:Translation elongation factor P/YeiP central domain-containing protein n=1 Tax=Smittium megazygosporum TaxID=133381 RepID=A0A2T9XYB5_9FUNG|nr:hypothetical protein BB560_007172 [Smittium megazygosporum]